MSETIKVGDSVMWRGSWGADAPCKVKVTAIELCEQERGKYGIPVTEVFIRDLSRSVFTLSCGNWAYGSQISPLTA